MNKILINIHHIAIGSFLDANEDIVDIAEETINTPVSDKIDFIHETSRWMDEKRKI